MITDLHVHTEMSCDSEAKISDYIDIAKKKENRCGLFYRPCRL